MALWAGAVLLLACLLSIDLAFRFARGTQGELAAGLVSVAYLGVGWLFFLGGLAKLSGRSHRRSRARGPWLVLGVVFLLVCAPAAASFVYSSDSRQFTYDCTCGCRVRAHGSRNCWGHWLSQRVAVVGRRARPNVDYDDPRTCKHGLQAPWQNAGPN